MRSILTILLFPFSLLYGIGTGIRNFLFDAGIIKSKRFDFPVISVGNITAGGTGKTPHIELLIEILNPTYTVAVLSRGYKRKTTGFLLADATTHPQAIGDEPYQIKQKFPQTLVAVDENRKRGIEKLMQLNANVILLDDAFQHRAVTPGLSILLNDYNRPIYNDCLLPVGLLRESFRNRKRADIVITTKCDVDTLQKEEIKRRLKLGKEQKLFYSTIEYGEIKALFSSETKGEMAESVLLATGIANPEPVKKYMEKHSSSVVQMQYPDHHDFSEKDLKDIQKEFNRIRNTNKMIVVTEKDAVKIACMEDIPDEIKQHIFYIPIQTTLLEQPEAFKNTILNYVEQNRRIN